MVAHEGTEGLIPTILDVILSQKGKIRFSIIYWLLTWTLREYNNTLDDASLIKHRIVFAVVFNTVISITSITCSMSTVIKLFFLFS